MREIKFRAWDKERKEFLSAGQILISVESGKNPSKSQQYLDILKDPNAYTYRFVLMQYTGRKDKNNCQICEGDIVQRYDDETGTIIELIEAKIPDIYFEGWVPFGEIVGNIYENPKLLKKQCEAGE